MAKYSEVSEQNENIFADIVAEADLERVINVKVLSDNRQKEIGKVIKANPLIKHMTNEDVVIIVNEKIFDGLADNHKRLVADQLVTWIGYDFEHDKLNICKPDVVTFSGILRKYTFEIFSQVSEAIKLLYEAKNQDEAENGETEDGE